MNPANHRENLTAAADDYLRAKATADAAKAEADALRDVLIEAMESGLPVVASNGKVATLGTQERREYKVSGAKGMLALLRNNPALDPADFLAVKPAPVKKLGENFQAALAFTAKVSKVLRFG